MPSCCFLIYCIICTVVCSTYIVLVSEYDVCLQYIPAQQPSTYICTYKYMSRQQMAPENIKHCLIQYCHVVVLFIPDVSEYNYLNPFSLVFITETTVRVKLSTYFDILSF
jgi:hypothetical protein